MKLIIVESPTKAKTISQFLPDDFKVESSYGHIRDLPKSKLGIDIEHGFNPQYVIPKTSQKRVGGLKKSAEKADKIILATDEDREGEAIAWHIVQVLNAGHRMSSRTSDVQRIVFHEITKKAVEQALANPRNIDMNLVDSQQARRILDRLVGYKLSPFLWKKLMRGLSAGRVQSVALRLVAERENEIRNFKSEDYWTIVASLISNLPPKARLAKGGKSQISNLFEAILIKIDDKPITKPGLKDKKEVDEILKNLKDSQWEIIALEKKAAERIPYPPFTTSTLQQTGWQRLRFSAKKTMLLAQNLYETGLITYMRTDSLNIAEEALTQAQSYLKENFSPEYGLPKPRQFKTSSRLAQEAHEAIRPTDVQNAPEKIKSKLSSDQFKLYDLIWRRFVAGQMPNAIFENTTVLISAENKHPMSSGHRMLFQAKGSILRFDGFLKIYPLAFEDKLLPELGKNQKLGLKELKAEEHQTQPPARYNEASLVKTLEKFGIGRPSTYAPIISVIQERGYVQKNEQKRFAPTEIGEKVNALLVKNFPKIVDLEFTRNMEEDLDEIADGKKQWAPVIKNFYEPFEKNLEEKYETVEKQDLTEPSEEVCDKCGKPMVFKHGRFGRFLACSGFPECKNAKKIPPISLNIACPKCGSGEVVQRKTKKGRTFFGCSRWPECDFAAWQKPQQPKEEKN